MGLGPLLCVLVPFLAPAASGQVPDEFGTRNRAWNGLASLLAIAEQQGIEVMTPAELELSQLSANDALLIVHPTASLPIPDLAAFMREGGRLGVADDFGTSDALLSTFDIERVELDGALAPAARRLRGNRNVLVASPRTGHPLTAGVRALVLNHPRALRHADLAPLYALSEDGAPVALAGAVGSGRLVAVADSSVLINNMLEFDGNRVFAENLIDYLAQGRRLWLVAGATPWAGRYQTTASQQSLSGLQEALERIARVELPRAALSITTLVIAAALLIVAATALPRRSAYARSMAAPAAPTIAGLAGRMHYYGSGSHNLLHPLMVYKQELEARLGAALGLSTQVSAVAVERAMRTRGAAPDLIDETEALLGALAAAQLAMGRPAPAPVVSAARFRATVERGERILTRVAQVTGPGARPSPGSQVIHERRR